MILRRYLQKKIEFRYEQLATVKCAKKRCISLVTAIKTNHLSVFFKVFFSLYNNIYLTEDPLDEEV